MIHEHGDSMNISSNEDNPLWSIRHPRITILQKIVISLVLFTIAKISDLQIACVLLVGNRPRGNSRDQKRRRKCRLYKWIRSEKLFQRVGHILKTRPQHNTTQRYELMDISFSKILLLILHISQTTKNKNAISDERDNWNNGGQEEMNEMNDWYILKFIFLLRTYRFFSDDVHNKLWVKERWLYPGPSIYSTAQNELLIIN